MSVIAHVLVYVNNCPQKLHDELTKPVSSRDNQALKNVVNGTWYGSPPSFEWSPPSFAFGLKEVLAAGGNKFFVDDVYAAAFNHITLEEIRSFFLSIPHELYGAAADVIIIVAHENHPTELVRFNHETGTLQSR